MQKYLTIFTISWQSEFIYRINFLLWRLRNILRFLMTYFLWSAVFINNTNVFGYNRSEILTYVFIVLIVSTAIISAPSADFIGGEIGNGELSNYLLKPFNYLGYWFTRDLANKLLNILFSVVEVGLLYVIFKPNFVLHGNLVNYFGFLLSLILAVIIYFLMSAATRLAAFWMPEDVWGISFLVIVLTEVLAGMMFPLDVLPKTFQTLLQFTPFPYLMYYPVQIFQNKITDIYLIQILLQTLVWAIIMLGLTRLTWKKGLKVYGAEGR